MTFLVIIYCLVISFCSFHLCTAVLVSVLLVGSADQEINNHRELVRKSSVVTTEQITNNH